MKHGNSIKGTPNTDISKKKYYSVFKESWNEVMSPAILVSTFRKSGIYPLDRGQISNEQLLFTAPSSAASSPPEPPSNNASGTVQAFEALEAVLSTPSRAKYRRVIEENYDL